MSLKIIIINATIWGMNGILLVNHFLRSEKFNELHTHIIDSARKMNIDLTLKTNLEELKGQVFLFLTVVTVSKNVMIRRERILSLTALSLSRKH